MTLYIDQTKTHTDDINFNTNEMDVRVGMRQQQNYDAMTYSIIIYVEVLTGSSKISMFL